jgi:hypothetical protein
VYEYDSYQRDGAFVPTPEPGTIVLVGLGVGDSGREAARKPPSSGCSSALTRLSGVQVWCWAVDYRRGARSGTDAGTVTDDDSRAARMSACVAQFVAAADMNWLLP